MWYFVPRIPVSSSNISDKATVTKFTGPFMTGNLIFLGNKLFLYLYTLRESIISTFQLLKSDAYWLLMLHVMLGEGGTRTRHCNP